MKQTGELLKSLRKYMNGGSNGIEKLSAYIIPTDDAHQSEYIAPRDERRTFICGFDGSAGTAVVTHNEALLWTDGRYYLQASQQLDANWTLMKDGLPTTPSIGAWLAKNFKAGDVVGVDANLLSTRSWDAMNKAIENSGCLLKPVTPNLVDLVWGSSQPAKPDNKIIALDTKYAGKTVAEKLKEVREKMVEQNSGLLVLSALDEVAYFFNLRGSDIDYNPVFFSYALITHDELFIFVDPAKVTPEILKHFQDNEVTVKVKSYGCIFKTFKSLIEACQDKVWISVGSSEALTSMVPKNKRHQEITPICFMKAIKNEVEVQGMINSHIRDGVALVEYFSWLEKEVKNKNKVTEITGGDKLEELRSKKDKFMGLSFPTINGVGPNGSIIHYHPMPETERDITDTEMYLCDSGAQYLDGTTDVTRTWHFGTPTAFEIECFTRVLKGQMSLGSTIFPMKVKGRFLDTLARKSLWDAGLDYGHGTGHGIGMFLNVHEGPMGIGIREMPDDPGLQANMFLSNEPGYYEDGKFGIRIEDIVQIVPTTIGNNFNNRGALTFHTITLCPIQTKLIDVKLLNDQERNYLNSYHKRVYETLAPLIAESDSVDKEYTLSWLKKETQPI